jgi:hypothetical protein
VLERLLSPGTLEDEPNPFDEWISEPGSPPGTRIAPPLALLPPAAGELAPAV